MRKKRKFRGSAIFAAKQQIPRLSSTLHDLRKTVVPTKQQFSHCYLVSWWQDVEHMLQNIYLQPAMKYNCMQYVSVLAAPEQLLWYR